VVLAVAQDVLGSDRQEPAQREGPERAALRLDEQREADTADVRALEVDDLAAVEPGKQRLRRRADRQREHQSVVAAEHVIAELRRDQNERDEKRDEIARIDPATEIPGARDRVARGGRRLRHVAHPQRLGSVIVTS